MAAKKRSGQTRRKGPTPRNPQRRSSTTTTAPAAQPAPSGRYTPKAKARGPFRPTWHRAIGALLVVAGLGLLVVNDLAWFDITLLPGGHNELWAVLGIATAATSTWWFGWFDRTPKPSAR
jgi:hypothetical protein